VEAGAQLFIKPFLFAEFISVFEAVFCFLTSLRFIILLKIETHITRKTANIDVDFEQLT
jgi:hypothetical protein